MPGESTNALRILFSTNLRKQVERMGISQKQFALNIGATEAVVSNWLNGKRFPEEKAIVACANFFQINVSELFKSTDEHITDEATLRNNTIIDGQEVNFYTTTDQQVDFAFVVKSDEMSPEYEKNDVIFCKSESEAENGDLVIVDINGKKCVRRIYFTPVSIIFVCSNIKYAPQQYVVGNSYAPKIIGKPIGYQRTILK